ncbi:hypothetical protein [Rhodoglobus aureus]|uniref:Uncharacterized protein n=1 Tax=Rhodoglobus aureus TaxID=191497 RepID=A0ABN1VGS6_9MICO
MAQLSPPASHRARWATAAYLGAAVLGVNQFLWGTYPAPDGQRSPFSSLMATATTAFGILSLILLTFAVMVTVGAIVAHTRASRRLSALPHEMPEPEPSLMTASTPEPPSKRSRLLVSAATFLTTVGVVAIGILHIYAWNPQSKMPNLSLDEIYAAMTAAHELPQDFFSWVWAIFWPLVALAFGALTVSPVFAQIIRMRGMLVSGLAIVSLTAGFHWIAGFSMGMGLADTFSVGGGDSASSGPLLGMFGQVCAVVALFLAIVPRRTNAGRLPEQTTRVVTN